MGHPRNNHVVDKASLRSSLNQQRRTLAARLSPADRSRWDERTTERVLAVLNAQTNMATKRVLASYQALSTEPPTQLLNDSLSATHDVWLPTYRDAEGNELPELLWSRQSATHDIVTSREFAQFVDVVIVPALAATPDGSRIGKGRGYYDRFLSILASQQRAPVTVALVRDSELLASIPCEPHDQKVSVVVPISDP